MTHKKRPWVHALAAVVSAILRYGFDCEPEGCCEPDCDDEPDCDVPELVLVLDEPCCRPLLLLVPLLLSRLAPAGSFNWFVVLRFVLTLLVLVLLRISERLAPAGSLTDVPLLVVDSRCLQPTRTAAAANVMTICFFMIPFVCD